MLHTCISKKVCEGEDAVCKTYTWNNGVNGGQSNGCCGHVHLDECSCAQLFVMLKERNMRILQNYSMLSTCFVRAIDTRCVCVCGGCRWSSLAMFTITTSLLLKNILYKVKDIERLTY